MSRRKEKKGGGDDFDPNAWMATFSDLNFLMITFFVLLLSMSSMDERRFSDIFGDEIALSEDTIRPEPPMGRSPLPAIIPSKGAWVGYPQNIPVDEEPGNSGQYNHDEQGVLQQISKAAIPDPEGLEADESFQEALERVRDLLQIEKATDEEVRISVDDALFFEGDEYRPTKGSQEILRALAELANEYDGELQVQAHRGSWELAAKRSASVARALARQGVPGERLSADVIVGPEGSLNFAINRTISQRSGEPPSESEGE